MSVCVTPQLVRSCADACGVGGCVLSVPEASGAGQWRRSVLCDLLEHFSGRLARASFCANESCLSSSCVRSILPPTSGGSEPVILSKAAKDGDGPHKFLVNAFLRSLCRCIFQLRAAPAMLETLGCLRHIHSQSQRRGTCGRLSLGNLVDSSLTITLWTLRRGWRRKAQGSTQARKMKGVFLDATRDLRPLPWGASRV